MIIMVMELLIIMETTQDTFNYIRNTVKQNE